MSVSRQQAARAHLRHWPVPPHGDVIDLLVWAHETGDPALLAAAQAFASARRALQDALAAATGGEQASNGEAGGR